MINMPGLIALLAVCCVCGMVVFAQYKDCDPLINRGIKKDQVSKIDLEVLISSRLVK